MIRALCILLLTGTNLLAKNKLENVDLSQFSAKLKGKLDKYTITMYLSIANDKVKGIYHYGQKDEYETLDGTISVSGNCILSEQNDKGKIIAILDGKITANNFNGIWKKVSNGEKLEFKLDKLSGTLYQPPVAEAQGPTKTINSESNKVPFYLIGGLALAFGIVLISKRRKPKVTPLQEPSVIHSEVVPVEASQPVINNPVDDTITVILSDEQKPEGNDPEEAGFKFENYIAEKFLKLNNPDKPKYFTIHTWQGDKRTKGGTFAKSNGNPDFIFNFNFYKTKGQFSIECKYHWNKYDTIDIATTTQLTRYKLFAKTEDIDVYMVIGLEGTPDNPKELFCIPLEDVSFPDIDYNELNDNYRIHNFNYDQNLNMLNPPLYRKIK